MKKVLSVLLETATAVSVCCGLAACGEDTSKTILVWAPSAAVNCYKQLANEWKAANPEYKDWTVKFEAQEEDVVQDKLGQKPSTKAHIFFFPSDHINAMLKKNALQPLTDDYRAIVEERDEASVVNDAIRENKLYAFPATYDNGYMLYYDKTFYTNETDVQSLDTLQSKAKAQNKNILFNWGSGYYASSMFWAAGCEFGYTDDSLTTYQTNVDGEAGQAAALACYNYFNPSVNGSGTSQTIIDGDVNTDIGTGFADRSMVAAIGGSWAYADIKTKMELAGRDMSEIGITTLPTFKLNGSDTHMYSFIGYKYCGVNGQKTDAQIVASLSLASYFTGEEGQEARFDATNAGPSNKKVAALPKVQSNDILRAFTAQTQWGVAQKDHPSAFWSPNIISDISNGTITQAGLVEAVETWAKELRKG
ncbi:MAG: extracellular solute-binding protein [Clostridiales bacterium]|nr:extracellular solute-binding protein [Clostridiales bacterium]